MTHEYIFTRDILRSIRPRDQENLSKVTRPFPRWEGSGNETREQGGGLPPLRNTHMTEAAYYACIVYVRRYVKLPRRPDDWTA